MLHRREFIGTTLGAGAAVAAASVGPSTVSGAVAHRPLDPVNPDILFGSTSSLWGGQHDIEWAIKRIAWLGLQGIEPYAQQIEKYRSDPRPLKKLFDEAGITLIDVSNGAQGPVDQLHRSRSDPEDDCRPRGVRARLSPAVRRHALEVQYGRKAGRRPERRSAQETRQHAQRDRQTDDCDGNPAGSASAYLGARWSANPKCAA